ncbi:ABC transporter ATP-binding protein [Geminicoccaceae bacterium 1502E]|nr:ABC transporter ATP-binding protein [Geminicoccaceae bacterium 1502E]
MAFLEVADLSVEYAGRPPAVAVQNVSFELEKGQSLGLVGESGCGKSTLSMALLGLLPNQARVIAGSIEINGEQHVGMGAERARRKRWVEVAYVPQNASTSLSPVNTLFEQFRHTWLAHRGKSDRQLREIAGQLFRAVELDEEWLDAYPHQLSGGMRQRAIIALSLLFNPGLLIADEPTTGLDVIVQRQVIDVLKRLQAQGEMSLVFVSHDIAVVSELCRKLAVMYAGQIVEFGPTADVMDDPVHPYTISLKQAFPDIGRPDKITVSIPGRMPLPGEVPRGCSFAPRCPFRTDRCIAERPRLRPVKDGRLTACHYSEEAAAMTRTIESGKAWIAMGMLD